MKKGQESVIHLHPTGFNEPDGCTSGGSCIAASDAATVWKTQLEPLKRDFGVKLGAPAVTGATTGFTWLQNFFTACSAQSSNGTSCDVDFIPVHWVRHCHLPRRERSKLTHTPQYGNFEGLASHIGQVNATYAKNVSAIWVTEFACADCNLNDAQYFYNQSTSYLDDQLDYVTHYSYFGAFRSDVSNVGPNAAFLTSNGKLTDIGSWYLGHGETGNVPKAAKSSSASPVAKFAGWSVVVGISVFWALV